MKRRGFLAHFVLRVVLLGLVGLIFSLWYALNFRHEETPEEAKMRLIQRNPVRVYAKVFQDDPLAPRGRYAPKLKYRYTFSAGGRDYVGLIEDAANIHAIEITYYSQNPDLHCIGNPGDHLSKGGGDFSLGFVLGTGLAFGLGLPLLIAAFS